MLPRLNGELELEGLGADSSDSSAASAVLSTAVWVEVAGSDSSPDGDGVGEGEGAVGDDVVERRPSSSISAAARSSNEGRVPKSPLMWRRGGVAARVCGQRRFVAASLGRASQLKWFQHCLPLDTFLTALCTSRLSLLKFTLLVTAVCCLQFGAPAFLGLMFCLVSIFMVAIAHPLERKLRRD